MQNELQLKHLTNALKSISAFPVLLGHLVDVELEPLDGIGGGLRDLLDAARTDGAHDEHSTRGLSGSS